MNSVVSSYSQNKTKKTKGGYTILLLTCKLNKLSTKKSLCYSKSLMLKQWEIQSPMLPGFGLDHSGIHWWPTHRSVDQSLATRCSSPLSSPVLDPRKVTGHPGPASLGKPHRELKQLHRVTTNTTNTLRRWFQGEGGKRSHEAENLLKSAKLTCCHSDSMSRWWWDYVAELKQWLDSIVVRSPPSISETVTLLLPCTCISPEKSLWIKTSNKWLK